MTYVIGCSDEPCTCVGDGDGLTVPPSVLVQSYIIYYMHTGDASTLPMADTQTTPPSLSWDFPCNTGMIHAHIAANLLCVQ